MAVDQSGSCNINPPIHILPADSEPVKSRVFRLPRAGQIDSSRTLSLLGNSKPPLAWPCSPSWSGQTVHRLRAQANRDPVSTMLAKQAGAGRGQQSTRDHSWPEPQTVKNLCYPQYSPDSDRLSQPFRNPGDPLRRERAPVPGALPTCRASHSNGSATLTGWTGPRISSRFGP